MSSKCVRSCDGLPPKLPVGDMQQAASQRSASPYPVPYTFRVPAPTPRKGSCGAAHVAKAPPFYMQLDHAVAVLWCLFRKMSKKNVADECEVGVAQLQWALYFLKGIKPPNGGDRAEDVSIAIQVVQDALLERYADMATVVMQPPVMLSMSSPTCTRCDAYRRGYTAHMSWMPCPPGPSCRECSSVPDGPPPRKLSKGVVGYTSNTTIMILKKLPTGQQKDDALEQETMELNNTEIITRKRPSKVVTQERQQMDDALDVKIMDLNNTEIIARKRPSKVVTQERQQMDDSLDLKIMDLNNTKIIARKRPSKVVIQECPSCPQMDDDLDLEIMDLNTTEIIARRKPAKTVTKEQQKDEALEQEIMDLKNIAAELAKQVPNERSIPAELHKEQTNRVKKQAPQLKSLQQPMGDLGVRSNFESDDSSFNPQYNSTRVQGTKTKCCH